MARKFDPTLISSGPGGLSLDDIPDTVKEEVEDMWKVLRTAPTQRFRVAYDTAQELDEYLSQVRAYCDQRPQDKGGPLRFRKSPAKNLPQGTGDFRITAVDEPEPTPVPAGTSKK